MTTKTLNVRLAALGSARVDKAFRDIGASGTKAGRQIAAATKPATLELQALNKASVAVNNVLRQGTALLAGYAGFRGIAEGVKTFADFQTGLVGVGKTANISGDALKSFGADIENMSLHTLPVATDKLLEIAQAAGQVGVTGTKNIEAFTDTIAKLEVATDLQGADAATTLARLLNVTGEAAGTVHTLGSVIVALGNDFAASESEIAHHAQEVALAKGQYEVTSAQAAALGTVLAAMGNRAEGGGTAIGRSLRVIDAALRGGGDALKALEDITGQTGDTLRKTFEQDATQAFQIFLAGLKRIASEGGSVAGALDAVGLSGDEILKVLPTLALRSDEVARAFDVANQQVMNATALDKEAAAAFSTLKSEGELLQNTIDSVSRAFGAGFAPALNETSQNLRGVLSDSRDTAQSIGEELGGAVRTLGEAAGVLVDNLHLVVTAVGGLVIARTAAGAFTVLTAALSARTGAIVGLRLMASVSKVAAAQMLLTAAAASTLRTALTLVGGPVGAVALLGYGLYELSDAQDAAREAAFRHNHEIDRFNDLAAKAEAASGKQAKAYRDEAASILTKDMALLEIKKSSLELLKVNAELEKKPHGPFGLFGGSGGKTGFLGTHADTITQQSNVIGLDADIAKLQAEIDRKQGILDDYYIKNTLPNEGRKKYVPVKLEDPFPKNTKYDQTKDQIKRVTDYVKRLQTQTDAEKDLAAAQRQGGDAVKEQIIQNQIKETLLRSGIDDLKKNSEAYIENKSAIESLIREQVNLAESQDRVNNVVSAGEQAFVRFAQTGKLSVKSLVDSIIADFARLAYQKYFSGAVASLASSVFAAFHDGGVVGDTPPLLRNVSANVFTGAQRMHSGGIAGLGPNEVPIIAEKGEVILPAKKAGQAVSPTLKIEIVDERPGGGGKQGVQVSQRQSANGMQTLTLRILDIVREGFGAGQFDGVFNNIYGLRRRGG